MGLPLIFLKGCNGYSCYRETKDENNNLLLFRRWKKYFITTAFYAVILPNATGVMSGWFCVINPPLQCSNFIP